MRTASAFVSPPRYDNSQAHAHAGTVLLHLVAASLGRRISASSSSQSPSLAAVYIPVPSPFPQLEAFIDDAASAYHLDLFHCPPPADPLPVESVPTPGAAAAPIPERPKHVKGGEGMRLALELYKARFPQVEAILIGTRRSDPHGGECLLLASHTAGFLARLAVALSSHRPVSCSLPPAAFWTVRRDADHEWHE